MYPNSAPNGTKMEPVKNPAPMTPPESPRQQRLQKAIEYFSSKMFLIQIVTTIVFSIFEIIYGTEYMNQCPVSPNIPIFLLVHGSVKTGWIGCSIIAFIEARFFSNSFCIGVLMAINGIIQLFFLLFFLSWFIAGNVWVWSVTGTYQSTNSSDPSTYCQSTLYSAAKGILISDYVVFGIIALITIRRRLCRQNTPPNQNDQNV